MKKVVGILLFFSLVLPGFTQVRIGSAQEALAIALKNSNNHIFQQMMVRETMTNAKLSLRDFLPTLGFSYSESDTVKKGMADSRSKTFQITLSQLVFDGGEAWNNYKIKNLQSLYDFQVFLQDLERFKAQVLDGYQGIVMQQEVVKIKKGVKESAFLRKTIMEKELELGLVREIDYLDYVISCRKLEQEEKLALEELKKQKEKLRQILGLAYGAEILVTEGKDTEESDFIKEMNLVSPYYESLVELALDYSPSLKQERLEYEGLAYQEKMNKRWFLPKLSLEGSLNLSGVEFPLREPDFSLRLKISFEKNSLIPFTNTTSMGFNQERLQSFGNSVSASINPDIGYFSQNRLLSISLLQKQHSLGNSEEEIRNSTRELLLNYDINLENFQFTEASVEIQEKKVAIIFQELENGKVTEMDYLKSLMELSALEIQAAELRNNLNSLLRTIELTAGLKTGGINELITK